MHISDRLYQKKWGVFNHYTPHIFKIKTIEEWNKAVDSFDTERLAHNLKLMGAGYYFITLNHGTKFMLCPNETYENLVEVKKGELCAKRDLPADLYKSLSKYDIDLYLYFNASGPFNREIHF